VFWAFFFGIIVLVVCAVPVFYVIRLMSIKLLSGELHPILVAGIPEAQVDILQAGEQFMANQGFERRCYVSWPPIIEGQPWGLYGVLNYHSQTNSWALVYVESSVHAVFTWRVMFLTPAEENNLYTECQDDISANIAAFGFKKNDPVFYDPAELWHSHQQFIKNENPQSAEASDCEIMRAFEVLIFKGLVLSGAVKDQGGYFTLTALSGFKIWRNSTRIKRQLLDQKKQYEQKTSDRLLTHSSPSSEYAAYQSYKTIQDNQRAGWFSKTAILLASVILFGISFGFLSLSLQSLVILIAVLFFHELGHLLGMWFFGYRDLRMLFIPFMGALASGRKENITAIQEAVVLLLGPLPGYCLGLWLLFSPASETLPAWLSHYGFISVVLNALNLLPFMPLDGGRVVNLALFNRLPYAQFLFMLFSVAAMLIAGYTLGEWGGYVIAGLILFSLPQLRVEVMLLKQLLKDGVHKQAFSQERLLQAMFTNHRWRKLSVQKKWAMLDSISYRVQHASAGLLTSVFIFLLWLSTIVLPLGLFLPPEHLSLLKFYFPA
jgi:Zn-dependent protease